MHSPLIRMNFDARRSDDLVLNQYFFSVNLMFRPVIPTTFLWNASYPVYLSACSWKTRARTFGNFAYVMDERLLGVTASSPNHLRRWTGDIRVCPAPADTWGSAACRFVSVRDSGR